MYSFVAAFFAVIIVILGSRNFIEKTSLVSHTALRRPVAVDLIVCNSTATDPKGTCGLDLRRWTRVKKDLYSHKLTRQAWLYVAVADESELKPDNKVIVNVTVSESSPTVDAENVWESRSFGIWILRRTFARSGGDATISDVNVLFGEDAVDPRPGWALMQESLHLGADPKLLSARLSIRYSRAQAEPNICPHLRVNNKGTFKILQISDTHMVTGVGNCGDAIDADNHYLPESEADPLTVRFIDKMLDSEKPDLVILTGDQLHHDISDSQTALFKVLSPMIKRSVPYAIVFGNHDSEGAHALSREEQMAIIQDLPFSVSEPGPDHVDGVGNYYLEVMATTSLIQPLFTLFFLDSHSELPRSTWLPRWIRKTQYDYIHQNQIDWFTNTSQQLRNARHQKDNRSEFHPSLVFQHIPLPEFTQKDLVIRTGLQREPVEGPSFNTHFYEALRSEEVTAFVCGHDHVNDFCAFLDRERSGNVQLPWLCYGGVAGFGGYGGYGKRRYRRRMRVWELDSTRNTLTTWIRDEHGPEKLDEITIASGEPTSWEAFLYQHGG